MPRDRVDRPRPAASRLIAARARKQPEGLTLALSLAILLALSGVIVSCGAATPAAIDSATEPTEADAAPSAASNPLSVQTPSAEPTPTAAPNPTVAPTATTQPRPLVTRTGAGSLVDQDLAPLHGLRVGLIAHRASVVDDRPVAHLIDEHPLVELVALFAPEHGLYGTADAGSAITDSQDPTTGAPVYSLYGTDRAPTPASLTDIDVLVYDLQDVGVRFYTYTSTLGLAMQAAAAADVDFVVLDRPNPIGGDGLQGPSLVPWLESFVGMYNVPSAYGLTSGELAMLIRDQALMPGVAELDLTIVPMQHWSRDMRWADTGLQWRPPSPNLPTSDSALVYPGTVLFEATAVSEGRGTDEPFQLIGAPWIDGVALAQKLNNRDLAGVSFEAANFSPGSIPGAAESPRFEGQALSGVRISVTDPHAVNGLSVGLHVLDAVLRHAESQGQSAASIIDRPAMFDRLAGNTKVRLHLIAGDPIADLLASFVSDHVVFRNLATDSLLYTAE